MTSFEDIRKKAIAKAKKDIRESVGGDAIIINTINNIDELATITNSLAKRLRFWYALYLPELSRKIKDHEVFVRLVLEKNKKALMSELKIKETMGAELQKTDLDAIKKIAERIISLYELRDELKQYIETVMNSHCKNLLTLAGGLLGAKLLREAGSLKKLALMASSKVQLLGAEKALFRHLKTGAKPPKHGMILQHPLIASTPKNLRGKHSRVLADKIVLGVRTDYFKGEFIADKLNKELQERLG